MSLNRTILFALLAVIALSAIALGYVTLLSRESQMASAQGDYAAKMAREGRRLPSAEDRRKLALRRGEARKNAANLDAWYSEGDGAEADDASGPAPAPRAFGDPVLAVEKAAPKPALVLDAAPTAGATETP